MYSISNIIDTFSNSKKDYKTFIKELLETKKETKKKSKEIARIFNYLDIDLVKNNIFPQFRTYKVKIYLDFLNYSRLLNDETKIQWDIVKNKSQRGISPNKKLKNIISMKLFNFELYTEVIILKKGFNILIEEFKEQSVISKIPNKRNVNYNLGDYHFSSYIVCHKNTTTEYTRGDDFSSGISNYMHYPKQKEYKFIRPYPDINTITLSMTSFDPILHLKPIFFKYFSKNIVISDITFGTTTNIDMYVLDDQDIGFNIIFSSFVEQSYLSLSKTFRCRLVNITTDDNTDTNALNLINGNFYNCKCDFNDFIFTITIDLDTSNINGNYVFSLDSQVRLFENDIVIPLEFTCIE